MTLVTSRFSELVGSSGKILEKCVLNISRALAKVLEQEVHIARARKLSNVFSNLLLNTLSETSAHAQEFVNTRKTYALVSKTSERLSTKCLFP